MKIAAALVSILVLAFPVMGQTQNEAGFTPSLVNPGFENPSIIGGAQPGAEPDKWFLFSSIPDKFVGVSDTRKKAGMQSLKLKAQAPTNAYEGIAQKFPAKAGKHYTFVIYAMSDLSNPLVGGSYGQISLEWHDDTGKEISRTHGPTWNFELPGSSWSKFLVEADAPENVAEGVAVVTFFGQDCNGQGAFYIDDCELDCR